MWTLNGSVLECRTDEGIWEKASGFLGNKTDPVESFVSLGKSALISCYIGLLAGESTCAAWTQHKPCQEFQSSANKSLEIITSALVGLCSTFSQP